MGWICVIIVYFDFQSSYTLYLQNGCIFHWIDNSDVLAGKATKRRNLSYTIFLHSLVTVKLLLLGLCPSVAPQASHTCRSLEIYNNYLFAMSLTRPEISSLWHHAAAVGRNVNVDDLRLFLPSYLQAEIDASPYLLN